MISIKKNNNVNLSIPKFLCDENAVGEHLNEHDLLALLNVYGFLCVCGRPGSGKTSFSVSLMTQKNPRIYKKTQHHYIIVMPQNSINSMKKNPFEKLENIYNELNERNITDIFNKIDAWSKENEKTILFIDDMTAELKNSKVIIDTLKKMVFNRRHLKLNIIITVQSYVNIPLDIRKNIQNLIMFKPSKKENELLFNELIETDKDKHSEIFKLVWPIGSKTRNFLFINVPSGRMFRNWDEIIIHEDSDSDSDLCISNDDSDDDSSSDKADARKSLKR